jgi:hypothetical protein
MTIAGQEPYVDLHAGAVDGYFVLDFGSTFSSIDPTAFASPGISTSGCDPTQWGSQCTVSGFEFFSSSPGSVSLTIEDYSSITGFPRQAGIIGTDFMTEKAITLDYKDGLVFASDSSGFCKDSALTDAGFALLTTAGYYENDTTLLDPASDTDSSAQSGNVPNVPTVHVSIGGSIANAQLDTGYDDAITPYSININEAFFNAIMSASPAPLVRDTSLDTSLSTCTGVSEEVTGYRVASGGSLDFLAVDGSVARSYTSPAIFVKHNPASASSCGGIGTWTTPGAQVAASYFNDMGTMIFDPFYARVWVPRSN